MAHKMRIFAKTNKSVVDFAVRGSIGTAVNSAIGSAAGRDVDTAVNFAVYSGVGPIERAVHAALLRDYWRVA